jgi:2-polyprenyl-3-methyl-5-hydroxy-6-metoxy-1,4-benzoquinol methylase
MTTLDERFQHEIEHGRLLVQSGNPERIWNWDSPAGKVRAARRGQLLIETAGLKHGMRTMEIGCGTGLFTELLATSGAFILAIDISPDLLALARSRKLPPEQVEFREMRFEDSDEIGIFDAIVGSSVLHHLDIALALPRMYTLLKPGGRIAFAEPNMLNPQVWAERHIPSIRRRNGVSEDETAIIRWQLSKNLRAIGFRNITIRNVDWLHPQTPQPLIRAVYNFGLVLEKIPVIKEFSGSVIICAQK